MNRAEKKMESIGEVIGKKITFTKNEIITLDYAGNYRVYSYNDQSVMENYTEKLHESATAIRKTIVLGDTLWFSTHESGVFAYLIKTVKINEILKCLFVAIYGIILYATSFIYSQSITIKIIINTLNIIILPMIGCIIIFYLLNGVSNIIFKKEE